MFEITALCLVERAFGRSKLAHTRELDRRAPNVGLFALSAACWLLLLASNATAQAAQRRVVTDDLVELAIPSSLREAEAARNAAAGIERVYTDSGSPPLQLFVLHDHARSNLPEDSQRLSEQYAKGFVQAIATQLKLIALYDVQPGPYDPARGAFSVQFKARAPSQAKQALAVPVEHSLWDPVRAAGHDPSTIRCLVAALLAGGADADAAQLQANAPAAAASCNWTSEQVQRYITDAGPAVFAPTDTAFASVALFTKQGVTQLLAAAPVARAPAVASLAALLWSSARVGAEARLETSVLSELQSLTATGVGLLLGTALGSCLALLLWASALAWLFGKLGASSRLAVGLACALLLLWSGLGIARTGSLQLQAAVQLVTYALVAALAFRPLTRWVARRTHSGEAR